MATLLPEGKQSFTDSKGAPLAGGKLFTYDVGTSTPRPTYQDAAATIPNTNPIVLDARGEATVFWSGTYKVVLTSSAGAVIWTVDGVADASKAISDFLATMSSSSGSDAIGWSQAGAGAVTRTVSSKLRDQVSPRDFGAVGDGVTDDSTAITAVLTHAALTGAVVCGGGKTYALGSTVTINSGFVNLNGVGFKALPSITTHMIGLDGLSGAPTFTNCVFDATHTAYSWLRINNTNDPTFLGCTFRAAGSSTVSVNTFGLWFINSKRGKVLGCTFADITAKTVSRAVYISGDCRGLLILGNSFSGITTMAQDGDAIVCEDYGSVNQGVVVSGNYFEDIQKRIVKAGGDGWVIQGNRVKVTGSGGLFSVVSFYGSDMVFDDNIIESLFAQVSYVLDIGASPTTPLVKNIRITNNILKLATYVSGTQSAIRLNGGVQGLYVSGNTVDECSYFFDSGNFTLTSAVFIANRTTGCADHEYALGNSSVSDVKWLYNSSLKTVASRAFIGGGLSVYDLVAIGNTYDKSFGLSSASHRFQEASGNMNAGLRETLSDYRNGVRWVYRDRAPVSGTFVASDVCWNTAMGTTSPVSQWVCIAGGTPGVWQASSSVVFTGPTGARAYAPVAADRGIQYLDTTLAANGKLITWTGSGWVDSAGTAV